MILKSTIKLTNFASLRRGPVIWNTILDTTLKEIESLPLSKKLFSHVTTRFRSFNDFKFDALLKYTLFSYTIISDRLY